MQAFHPHTAARHSNSLAPSAQHNPLVRLGLGCSSFIMHDRDRWVPVTCAAGFALLMWVDWLAA